MNTAPVASLPSGRRLPAAGVRALPGIGLVGLLALLALEIGRAPWLRANGISALTSASCANSSAIPPWFSMRARRAMILADSIRHTASIVR
jgi:hypothetical protein